MSTDAIRESSRTNPERKIFGYGYESNSPESPSVQTARAEFLSIILERKSHVVSDLIACYQAFDQFLKHSESTIAALVNDIDKGIPKEDWIQRQPLFLRERALENLLPNARVLETLEGANPLARSLKHWGLRHHLGDAWCLDDGLTVLREFDVMEEKPMAVALLPDGHYFIDVWKRAWQAAVIERRLSGLHGICQSSMAVEDLGGFSFIFTNESLRIIVSGPFYKSVSVFKREVNDRFREAGGTKVRGARKQLEYEMTKYLSRVDEITKKLKLTTRNWRRLEEHLHWLVDYQVPPCKAYRQIARDTEKDEKTIREAIQRSASLIGLSLRSNENDRKLGRPVGSKDKKQRRRVDHRKQKVRGFAN